MNKERSRELLTSLHRMGLSIISMLMLVGFSTETLAQSHHFIQHESASSLAPWSFTGGYSLAKAIIPARPIVALPDSAIAPLHIEGPLPSTKSVGISRTLSLLAEYEVSSTLVIRASGFYTLGQSFGDPSFGLEYDFPVDPALDLVSTVSASIPVAKASPTGRRRKLTEITVLVGPERDWSSFSISASILATRTLMASPAATHAESGQGQERLSLAGNDDRIDHFAKGACLTENTVLTPGMITFPWNATGFIFEGDYSISPWKVFVTLAYLYPRLIMPAAVYPSGSLGFSFTLE